MAGKGGGVLEHFIDNNRYRSTEIAIGATVTWYIRGTNSKQYAAPNHEWRRLSSTLNGPIGHPVFDFRVKKSNFGHRVVGRLPLLGGVNCKQFETNALLTTPAIQRSTIHKHHWVERPRNAHTPRVYGVRFDCHDRPLNDIGVDGRSYHYDIDQRQRDSAWKTNALPDAQPGDIRGPRRYSRGCRSIRYSAAAPPTHAEFPILRSQISGHARRSVRFC